MKNDLGQPSISDLATFFCDPCNAITCVGCPVNDILKNEQAAAELEALRQERDALKEALLLCVAPDGFAQYLEQEYCPGCDGTPKTGHLPDCVVDKAMKVTK